MNKKLFVILFLGFLVRLFLTVPVSFSDGPAFRFWALYLQDHSLGELFKTLPNGYTPYPPLYYYVLQFLGFIISIFHLEKFWFLSEIIMRLPIYISDCVTGFLIFQIVHKWKGKNEGFFAAIFFLFHPALLMTSTLWAQTDSIILLISLSLVWFLLNKQFLKAWIFFVLGILIKVQMIALVPLILFASFPVWRTFLKTLPILFILFGLPFIPVFLEQGFEWGIPYFIQLPNWYPYTSIYATNIWAVYGFIIPDTFPIFGIPLKIFSLAIVGVLALGTVIPFVKRKHNELSYYFVSFLLFFTFALFSTRVHSRYFIYALPFLALFWRRFPTLSFLFSFVLIFNLLLPVFPFTNQTPILYSVIICAVFTYLLSGCYYFQLLKNNE